MERKVDTHVLHAILDAPLQEDFTLDGGEMSKHFLFEGSRRAVAYVALVSFSLLAVILLSACSNRNDDDSRNRTVAQARASLEPEDQFHVAENADQAEAFDHLFDISALGPLSFLDEEDAAASLRIRDVLRQVVEEGSRRLVTQGCYEECLTTLLDSSYAASLLELRIEECGGARALRTLVEHSSQLTELRRLRVVGCTERNPDDDLVRRTEETTPVTDSDLAALLESPLNAQLLELGLPAQQLCRSSLELLSQPGALPEVQALDLRLNHCLGEEDFTWWANEDQRSKLEHLDLSFNRLGESFDQRLEERAGLPRLTETILQNLSLSY